MRKPLLALLVLLAPAVASAQEACPVSFAAGGKTSLTCTCNAVQAPGAVWGSGTYTQDSSLCTAALHAGAIPPGGGVVTAVATPGCDVYAGTTANGVTTFPWGPYEASFDFPATGAQTCAKVDAPDMSWVTGFRLDNGLAWSPDAIAMTTGAQVDFGHWSGRTYLGAVYSFLAEMAEETDLQHRFGLEGRYVFATGTGFKQVNDGPVEPTPILHWAGVSAGAELIGGAKGGWAALEYGLDFPLGRFQIGFIVSAGAAHDDTAPMAMASPTHFFTTFSVHLGIGH